jgi:hypothetical protein
MRPSFGLRGRLTAMRSSRWCSISRNNFAAQSCSKHNKVTASIGLAVLPVLRQHRGMKPALSTIGQMRLKPDSRSLGRGALGDAIDGRSREGKFVRRIESELLEQLGDNPSFAQVLLVRRAARAALKLELYDRKLAEGGEVTSHDSRMYGGLSNNLRLLLREISSQGVAKSKAKAATNLNDILARHREAVAP